MSLHNALSLDVILDIVLFEDYPTANAKLSEFGLIAIPAENIGTHLVSSDTGRVIYTIRGKTIEAAPAVPADLDAEVAKELTESFGLDSEEVRQLELRLEAPKPTIKLDAAGRITGLYDVTDERPFKSAAAEAYVQSTSDERTVNNTVRHAYRVLNDDEKAAMQNIKDLGEEFVTAIQNLGQGREYSIARTKVEEAVMWAVKGITA